MKKNIFVVLIALVSFAFTADAQSCCSSKTKAAASCTKEAATTAKATTEATPKAVFASYNTEHNETAKFTVYGNCGMCERTIEGALKNVKGVLKADWDRETDLMTVTYNPHVISLNTIKQKIADVGYDSDTHRVKDEVYNNLPGCCQYERPAPKKN